MLRGLQICWKQLITSSWQFHTIHVLKKGKKSHTLLSISWTEHWLGIKYWFGENQYWSYLWINYKKKGKNVKKEISNLNYSNNSTVKLVINLVLDNTFIILIEILIRLTLHGSVSFSLFFVITMLELYSTNVVISIIHIISYFDPSWDISWRFVEKSLELASIWDNLWKYLLKQ